MILEIIRKKRGFFFFPLLVNFIKRQKKKERVKKGNERGRIREERREKQEEEQQEEEQEVEKVEELGPFWIFFIYLSPLLFYSFLFLSFLSFPFFSTFVPFTFVPFQKKFYLKKEGFLRLYLFWFSMYPSSFFFPHVFFPFLL